MTKDKARQTLKNKGYNISTVLNGGYVAKKGQRTYIANTLNGLYNKILKPTW